MNTDASGSMTVTATTAEQQAQKSETDAAALEKEIREAVGFRRVLECLASAKKPVIVHNGFLDVCHSVKTLQMLPPTVSAFKAAASLFFPVYDGKGYLFLLNRCRVFDTKLIAKTVTTFADLAEKTHLNQLHATVTEKDFPSSAEIGMLSVFEKLAQCVLSFVARG